MTGPAQFSFEFFPPRTAAGSKSLQRVHRTLARLQPAWFSVTYGAGGSTRAGTVQTVLDLHQHHQQQEQQPAPTVAPHLSFGADDEATIGELLDRYQQAGINRLVALRGDAPSGVGDRAVSRHANELVTFIRQRSGRHFHIEVAAYPEVHPDSRSVDADLRYFKQKVDAGADAAVTQYFYNGDAYFRFIDETRRLGIDIPIVPGVMPITNHADLVRFSDKCGAEIPRWIRLRLQDLADHKEDLVRFGEQIVTDLCRRLLDGGAPGLHFYTLNKTEPTLTIWRNLGLPVPDDLAAPA